MIINIRLKSELSKATDTMAETAFLISMPAEGVPYPGEREEAKAGTCSGVLGGFGEVIHLS